MGNPDWGKVTTDFIVHDYDQVLSLRLYDSSSTCEEDLIGKIRPIDLHELTDNGSNSELVLDLTKPDGSETEGTVRIKTKFLKPSAGEGNGAAVLSVKLI